MQTKYALYTTNGLPLDNPSSFGSLEEASAEAGLWIRRGWYSELEVHIVSPHPLADHGIGWCNPVFRATAANIGSPKESLAILRGSGGGDVRESSCDPDIYPFVPVLVKSPDGEVWKLLHPTINTTGWSFGSRRLAEIVAAAIQRETGAASQAAAEALVLAAPADGPTWASKTKRLLAGLEDLKRHEVPELWIVLPNEYEAEKVIGLFLLIRNLPEAFHLSTLY